MGGAKSTTATHEAAAGAAAAPAAPAPAQVKKHIVQKGESLSLIAKHYYGDIHKWKQLYEANKAVIGDNPDLIQIGQELVIPD
ncbi:LysM peptidoglycan-binding domain-containing protein [Anaerolineae bacterium CFX7]|nr:LysM peptidoglycan-binding domain-containing protein [Anaerolineae bacterium CFX7]